MTLRLFWDFFGPDAEATARHHRQHLEERFRASGWEAEAFGTSSAGPGHAAATCDVAQELVPAIRAALRPQRALPAAEAD